MTDPWRQVLVSRDKNSKLWRPNNSSNEVDSAYDRLSANAAFHNLAGEFSKGNVLTWGALERKMNNR
ncbi:hypothetical protein GTA07_15160 [Rhodococcus hoagii]|nr:hypothetical protein [Prescottella equi]